MSKLLVDRDLLAKHVAEIDSWNASMERILGKQPSYKWQSLESLRAILAQPAPVEQVEQHSDDAAVDRFADAMKAKLANGRAKGRGGWEDPEACSVEFLARLLVDHLAKGNAGTFEDVANFAMMLHQRGADPRVLAEAAMVGTENTLCTSGGV
ncbi:hypothetical protein [Stutzerimonas stutzeri]|uniref:hypothetical protein n=1 Tax=Stutzerimonas stutzeri TaxID=316 RepID=UPI00265CEEEC|nr:hypothetical protein [Stutzerimonas stutzeri]MCF6783371.1 hypothetical protein [Stutzerimonas stutzeri]